MRRGSGSDHLAHSFTDLMTSLMVIFILLLLVFMNNQASVNVVTAQGLVGDLRQQLEPAGFKREDIRIDPKDPSTILLTMLDAQLTFEPNSYQLQPPGERFLETRMPTLTRILCADKYRGSIEAVVVEGHSDSAPWRGLSVEDSQQRNLKLSQERSMEVVDKTLTALKGYGGLRSCLLEKISAGGRGEQDLAETADKSRRAVIKVRVNAAHAVEFANALHGEKAPLPSPAPVAAPAAVKILDIFSKLTIVPRQPVSLRLSEDEVNQYLVYALMKAPRPGLDSIAVKFFSGNYVATSTVVDFDALQSWSPGLASGILDLTGKKAISIDVRFSVDASKDVVSYKIEKAFYQDKAIPLFVAEKIVQLIGARQPENVEGQAVQLPLGLKQIRTGLHYIEAEN